MKRAIISMPFSKNENETTLSGRRWTTLVASMSYLILYHLAIVTTTTTTTTTVLGRTATTTPKKIKSQHYRRRHHLTIDKLSKLQPRPTDAPLVDYGGRHPFDSSSTTSSSSPPPSSLQQRRELADIFYDPIRIIFDVSSLSTTTTTTTDRDTQIKMSTLIDTILPRAALTWSSVLHVFPVMGPLIIGSNKDRSNYSICPISPGHEHATEGVSDADLVIYVSTESEYCDGGEGDYLPQAYPCELDQFDRPIAGVLNFCLASIELNVYDEVSPSKLQTYVNSIVHELGHVLGMNSELFKFFRHPLTGRPLTPRPFRGREVECITGKVTWVMMPSCNTMVRDEETGFFEIVTPTVANVVRNQFDCRLLGGARLENQPQGDASCFGTNWDQRFFHNEAMASVYQTNSFVLSSLTLGLLEDSGWYRANYTSVKVNPFGHGAGCDFVTNDCILPCDDDDDDEGCHNGGKVPTYSKGSFCNQKLDYKYGTLDGVYGCDAGHQHKAYCDLIDYADPSFADFDNPPPEPYQYFKNSSTLGSFLYKTDYCPVDLTAESLSCENGQPLFFARSEYYGPGSRCFNRINDTTSLCLSSRCQNDTQTLEVFVGGSGNLTLTCNRSGEVLELPNGDGYVECPRMEAICPQFFCPANCAGRGLCSFASDQRRCFCFDENDDTAGCYDTAIRSPLITNDVVCGHDDDESKATTAALLGLKGGAGGGNGFIISLVVTLTYLATIF